MCSGLKLRKSDLLLVAVRAGLQTRKVVILVLPVHKNPVSKNISTRVVLVRSTSRSVRSS